jgi:hypothetical protein
MLFGEKGQAEARHGYLFGYTEAGPPGPTQAVPVHSSAAKWCLCASSRCRGTLALRD